jgi:uncharacterized hydrophobic protein (TIGR00271 family)
MKVHSVRNFYSTLENLGEEGSEFAVGYFALVVVATLIATAGLLANSIPVIVGSMCIAPFLGPSRAVCIGSVYKKWNTAVKGLIKQTLGLLAIGSPVAFFVTLTFLHLAPGITVTPTIIARTFPTIQSIYLSSFVALASGVAASLALTASPRIVSAPWQQLLDVMIGSEIAVSLIPPAAVVGIGLAFGSANISLQSLLLLMINVIGLDIVAVPVLYFAGVELKPLQIEKKIREATANAVSATVNADQVLTDIVLHGYKKADVLVHVQVLEGHLGPVQLLAQAISESIEKETGMSIRVKTIVTPVGVYPSHPI